MASGAANKKKCPSFYKIEQHTHGEVKRATYECADLAQALDLGASAASSLNRVKFILPETMKQFGCSVCDGPIWGIISRVFDVRRDFLAGYLFGSSIFDQKYLILLSQVRFSSVFNFKIHGCQFL